MLAIAAAGCGGGGSATVGGRSAHRQHRSRGAPGPNRSLSTRPQRLVYRELFSLPAPLRDPAAVALGGGRFTLLGGLDAADVSTDEIDVVGLHGVLSSQTLPLAQHDAQGALLDGKVYVFGGGSFSELDHIISFDPVAATVSTVGSLPHAQSDVAVAEVGDTAYVVGGYDGTNWLDTILAWRPGSRVHVAGRLPVGLRYAAAATIGGQVLVIGGSTPSGASDAVYRFDPVTGSVRQIGRLPQPITHGAAASLGANVYLVGGRGNNLNSQTASVWSINPLTGSVHRAARLPQPLSDTGVLSRGDAIIVAGGLSPTGTVAGVGELVSSAG